MFYNSDTSKIPKWQRVKPYLDAIKPQPDRVPTFEDIEAINDRINKYKYTSRDLGTWMTPSEFDKAGGGDCADFAVRKLAALLVAGFKPEDLEMRVGNLSGIGAPQREHAVVQVNYGGKAYTLDNRNNLVVEGDPMMKMDYGLNLAKGIKDLR